MLTMTLTGFATALVSLGALYLGLGTAFAAWFVAQGVNALDPAAAAGTAGFRMLLFPGAALLWPLLALRVQRSRRAARRTGA